MTSFSVAIWRLFGHTTHNIGRYWPCNGEKIKPCHLYGASTTGIPLCPIHLRPLQSHFQQCYRFLNRFSGCREIAAYRWSKIGILSRFAADEKIPMMSFPVRGVKCVSRYQRENFECASSICLRLNRHEQNLWQRQRWRRITMIAWTANAYHFA